MRACVRSYLGHECVIGTLVFDNQVLLGSIMMENIDLVLHPTRHMVTVNPLSPSIPLSQAK